MAAEDCQKKNLKKLKVINIKLETDDKDGKSKETKINLVVKKQITISPVKKIKLNIISELDSTKEKQVEKCVDEATLYHENNKDQVVDDNYSLLVHDDKVLFSCKNCELSFENYVNLKDHSIIEHGVTLQRKDCQHCLTILPSHNSLLLHLKEEHFNEFPKDQMEKLKKKFSQDDLSKKFFCEMCKKGFASKASLLNHLNKLHLKAKSAAEPKETNFSNNNTECSICAIPFSSLKELNDHFETIHNTKSYMCIECDTSFQSRSSLNLHNIYHHRAHRCSSCLLLFHGRLALTSHVKQQHPGMPVYRADSRYVCEYCSQPFSIRSHLSDHIQSFHLGKVNQCEDCGKVLSTTETLKVHRLKHKPEKHRTCEHCGKQFYRTGMLTEHIRACHSEMLSDEWRQRTTCPHCQARFTRRESMRRHIEAKHESKRFLCNFCERPFTCRRYLVRHENKHHLGRPSS